MSRARAASLTLGLALAINLAPAIDLAPALELTAADRALGAVIYRYQANPQPAPRPARRAQTGRPALHRSRPVSNVRTPSSATTHPSSAQANTRAPSGPPLTSAVSGGEGGASSSDAQHVESGREGAGGVPSAAGDQLVENGLSSPLCKGALSGGLSGRAQRNCRTSGFVGAPAPTNNYGLDVNIDVGAFGLSYGELLSVIQDVFIAPLWGSLVWMVHALVVMLEWGYTLELLGGSTMSRLASSLRAAQASFTQPWLALVLGAASVLVLYNGLIRRRVTETLGQALTTIAMMAAGLWVIANPLGTIGAVGRWANQASLGTLGAVTQGTPSNSPRTLGDSMGAVFSDTIEMPWCYLEFGNVRWCSDPALLDSRLRKAALAIAASREARLKCRSSSGQSSCISPRDASALTIQHSAELVGDADTNGGLFLAFAANRTERNSVKNEGSLLHVLCQAEDDTKCEGPTAPEAEFRSGGGTFPRMIGVVLIAAGVLGTVMALGFITLRLLAAAIASLFMLLLAPFAVLAPALGDSGRALFAGWATRLLGVVTSKLIYSFLLGALLTMQRLLASLQPLGWWTKWFLISAFWWGVFLKRHHALALLQHRGRAPVARRRSIARRVGEALETPRAVLGGARWVKRKILSPAPDPQQLRRRAQATQAAARARAGEQVTRTLERDHDDARARVQAGPRIQARLSAKREQLQRVNRARETALAGGDRRRAAKLAVRAERIQAGLGREQRLSEDARKTVADGERARRAGGFGHTYAQRERRGRFLDAQAALPSSSRRSEGAQRRDYVALAGLAGYGPQQYARLDPRARREARLRIDRELATRSQLGGAAHDAVRAGAPRWGRREQRKVDKELDRALEQRTRTSGGSPPRPPSKLPPFIPRPRDLAGSRERHQDRASAPRRADRPKSIVMDDAREVAERRKRQLGRRPS